MPRTPCSASPTTGAAVPTDSTPRSPNARGGDPVSVHIAEVPERYVAKRGVDLWSGS